MQYPTDLFSEYEAQFSDVMAHPSSKDSRIDWKSVLPTALTAAIFIGGFLWAAHSEISKITDRLDGLDKHLARVETAVRIVGAKQGGDTKTLVDEALTVAQNAVNSGRTDSAIATLAATDSLLREQPLRTDQSTIRAIGFRALKLTTATAPSVSNVAWNVTNSILTSYSAALPPPPLNESYLIHISTTSPTTECMGVGNAQLGVFQDFLFEGCTAHLDALFGPRALAREVYIENTVFKNAIIVYSGGPLRLRGIYFENCTFRFEPRKGSELFANQLLAQNSPFDLDVPPSTHY